MRVLKGDNAGSLDYSSRRLECGRLLYAVLLCSNALYHVYTISWEVYALRAIPDNLDRFGYLRELPYPKPETNPKP